MWVPAAGAAEARREQQTTNALTLLVLSQATIGAPRSTLASYVRIATRDRGG